MNTLNADQIKRLKKILGVDNLDLLITVDRSRQQALFKSSDITVTEHPPSSFIAAAAGLSPNCFPVECNIAGSLVRVIVCL